MRRALGAVPALLVALAAPVGAVGTGGVEFTPDPATTRDGRTVTAFHVDLPEGGRSERRYTLRNLTGKPVTIRLYAAAAERGEKGAYAVAGPGSAPWIGLADAELTLPPRGEHRGSFVVSAARAPSVTGTVYGAVVLERASASVVTRAATLVYLERGASPASRSRGPLYAAAGLAVLMTLAFAAQRFTRSATGTRRRPCGRSGQC